MLILAKISNLFSKAKFVGIWILDIQISYNSAADIQMIGPFKIWSEIWIDFLIDFRRHVGYGFSSKFMLEKFKSPCFLFQTSKFNWDTNFSSDALTFFIKFRVTLFFFRSIQSSTVTRRSHCPAWKRVKPIRAFSTFTFIFERIRWSHDTPLRITHRRKWEAVRLC